MASISTTAGLHALLLWTALLLCLGLLSPVLCSHVGLLYICNVEG